MMTDDTLNSSQLSFKVAALRVVDLPLSVYNSLAQVRKASLWRSSAGVVLHQVLHTQRKLNESFVLAPP